MLRPVLGSQVQGRHETTGESPAKVHENDKETETPLLRGKDEKSGTVLAWRRESSGRSSQCAQIHEGGGCKVTGARLFAVVSSDKTRASGHEVKGKRYCLHAWKCCFIVWVTEH